MTTTVGASLTMQMSAQKTITTGDLTLPSLSFALGLGQQQLSWSSNSTPNGLDAWSALVAMTAGTVTIDLTSLTQAGVAGTLNQTGNKLRAVHIIAPSTNSAVIQVASGASNGYTSIGTVSQLKPGDACIKVTSNSIAVDGTHKTIDVTGTGTDAVELLMVFGS